MNIRSGCPDLVCDYLNGAASSIGNVPSANGVNSAGKVPDDLDKVFEVKLSNLFGYYNVDVRSTRLHFFVDALASPGNAIEAAVSYDFNGM